VAELRAALSDQLLVQHVLALGEWHWSPRSRLVVEPFHQGIAFWPASGFLARAAETVCRTL